MKNNKIFYGKQHINITDKDFVNKALYSDLISSGDYVKNFEKKISLMCKSKYSLVCNSGTSALYLAFYSIGLKKNDVVLMPSINFISSYSMCKNFGAKIYLTDVDETGQISQKNILNCIKKFNIKKIKCIVSMHLGGSPRNIININKLKKKYKFFLIEDACHAFGSKYIYKSKVFSVGSCKNSDICTFSFHPIKSITTGEGGALTTNNKLIYEKSKLLRSHGIVKNNKKHWEYDIDNLGFNFRLSDINCALGLSQLKTLNKFIRKRNLIAKYYHKYLSNMFPYVQTNEKYDKLSSHHLFIIRINFNSFGKKCDKDIFLNFMKKYQIYPQYHYIPIYKFRFYQKEVERLSIIKNSERYYKTAVSLPIYFDLNIKEIIKVIEFIKKFINMYK